jgi:hypothetical protein
LQIGHCRRPIAHRKKRPHSQREKLRHFLKVPEVRQSHRKARFQIEVETAAGPRLPLAPLLKLRRVMFQRLQHVARRIIRGHGNEPGFLEKALPLLPFDPFALEPVAKSRRATATFRQRKRTPLPRERRPHHRQRREVLRIGDRGRLILHRVELHPRRAGAAAA